MIPTKGHEGRKPSKSVSFLLEDFALKRPVGLKTGD